jgi:hypothetical protein
MSRKLKPLEIETFTHHKLGVTVKLYLDREDKDFFANVGDEKLRAASHHDLRTAVNAAIERMSDLKWYKIIVIRLPATNDWNSGERNFAKCSFKHERFEVADRNPDGHGRVRRVHRSFRENDEKPERRFESDNVDDPLFGVSDFHWGEREQGEKAERNVFEIPYDEGVWNALEILAKRLNKAAEDLRLLIGSPDSFDTLKAIGSGSAAALGLLGLPAAPPTSMCGRALSTNGEDPDGTCTRKPGHEPPCSDDPEEK